MLLWRSSTVRAWLALIVAVATAAAGAFLTWLQLFPLPEADKAELRPWIVAAIAWVAVVAVWTTAWAALRRLLFGRRDEATAQVQQALRVLTWAVHEITGEPSRTGKASIPVDQRELGASAWIVQGAWKFAWLHRLGRDRFNADPPPSQITWRKGKGHIGQCWETGQKVFRNVYQDDQQLQKIRSKQEWDALPAEQRQGLRFDEYQKIRGKYGTVVAMPITDPNRGNRVIGVVSLDAPPGHHNKLKNPRVIEKVGQTADAILAALT